MSATETVTEAVAPEGYAPPEERPPLVPYAVAMLAFNGLFVGALAAESGRSRSCAR